MHLEHAVERSRRDVGEVEEGLPLGQIRGVHSQVIPDGHTQIAFPLLAFNDHQHFAGLAAHVGEKSLLLSLLAGSQGKDTGHQDHQSGNMFHTQ